MVSIGRYKIIREIGRGGMATVYEGFDPQFERAVAVKVLPPQFLHDPHFRVRFEREARTVATLEHIAIVPVYDFGEDDDQLYLVMRYMNGGNLATRLREAPLPYPEANRILSHVAPALDFAHQKGIIHRDVKPDNILFDEHDSPYLSDFGLVKINSEASVSQSGLAIGTPAYMSPEQIKGEAEITGRSDIYSLGAALFEICTGRHPFIAANGLGIVMKHLNHPVPNVRDFQPELPDHVSLVIEVAMAKLPEARFQTAVEMAEALLDPDVAREQHALSQATIAEAKRKSKTEQKEEEAVQPVVAAAAWGDTIANETDVTASPVPETEQVTRATDSKSALKQTPRGRWVSYVALFASILITGAVVYWIISLEATGDLPPETAQTTVQAGLTQPASPTPAAYPSGVTAIAAINTISQPSPSPSSEVEVAATQPPAPTNTTEPSSTPTNTPSPSPTATITETNTPPPPPVGTDQSFLNVGTIGNGVIKEIAFLLEGDRVAVATAIGVSLFDTQTISRIDFKNFPEIVASIDFSTDGQFLATGSVSGVQVWSSEGIVLIDAIEESFQGVEMVRFGPTADIILAVSAQQRILLWDREQNSSRTFALANAPITELRFSPNGTYLAAGLANGNLLIWEYESGALIQTLDGHTDQVHAAIFTRDERTLATGSADQTVRIWDITSGRLIDQFGDHRTTIFSLAFSPDGSKVASGGVGERFLFDLNEGFKSFEYRGTADQVAGLAFSADGEQIVTITDRIELFGLDQAEPLASEEAFNNRIVGLAQPSNQNEDWVAAGYDNGALVTWNIEETALVRSFEVRLEDLNAIAVSPAGDRIAASNGEDILILDPNQQQDPIERQLKGHLETVTALAFLPDGKTLISTSMDGTIRLWNLANNQIEAVLDEHAQPVTSLAVAPSGTLFVTGGADGEVLLWSATEQTLLQRWKAHNNNRINSLIFMPDERLVVSGADDSSALIWSIEENVAVYRMAHGDAVTALATDGDGKYLFTGSADNVLRIWDGENGRILGQTEGHNAEILALIVSAQNGTLITGSADGTLRSWTIIEE